MKGDIFFHQFLEFNRKIQTFEKDDGVGNKAFVVGVLYNRICSVTVLPVSILTNYIFKKVLRGTTTTKFY